MYEYDLVLFAGSRALGFQNTPTALPAWSRGLGIPTALTASLKSSMKDSVRDVQKMGG